MWMRLGDTSSEQADLGFGNVLGLNTGTGGAGENYMAIYVRDASASSATCSTQTTIQYQLATDAQGSEVVTVTLTDDGGTMKKITPANLGIGSGGGVTVQDEGSALSTTGTTLNFVGAGVTASGTGATKTITIAGGSDGVTVQDEGSALSTTGTTLNFVGAGVTASGTGATKTITISGSGSGVSTGKSIAMAMVFG